MAKITKEEENRQQKAAEAVSKADVFFKENGKLIYGCVTAILVIALCILAYNRFILQPKKQQATEQMAQAERWFQAQEYQLALEGDDNYPGFEEIIDKYGSKAGQAVYLYGGIAKLQTGQFEEAVELLKKYKGEDPILKGRAQACIGDAFTELENYPEAISWYQKAEFRVPFEIWAYRRAGLYYCYPDSAVPRLSARKYQRFPDCLRETAAVYCDIGYDENLPLRDAADDKAL